MKVPDVINGRMTTADLHGIDGEGFPAGLTSSSEVFLHCAARCEFQLQIEERVWTVEGTKPRDREILRQIGTRDLPRLVWLVQGTQATAPSQNLLIKIHEFPMAFVWKDPMDIGIDDRIVEDISKRLGRKIASREAVEFLEECVLLPPRAQDETARVLLSGIPALESVAKTAFRLYGRQGYAVDVERKLGSNLRVTRVVKGQQTREGNGRKPVYLATGQIKFCDQTLARQFRGIARTELDSLVAHGGGYLRIWEEYNSMEREAIKQRAKQFGQIRYFDLELRSDGTWRFFVDVPEIEIADWLHRLDAVSDDQLQIETADTGINTGVEYERNRNESRRPLTGKLKGKHRFPPSLDLSLELDRKPPTKGSILVYLGGDEIRIRRRTRAWEQIRSCENPMPQLGLLIEGLSVPKRQQRRLKPLTKSVREVLENPNGRQRLALDVALNTPDVALIQGPPGTGKTRLIAALQARLAERDVTIDATRLAGNALLTSFQHDAVENAAAATLVMGLPAVKVGYSRGVEPGQDGVERWCKETARKVRTSRGPADSRSVHTALPEVREIYLSAQKFRENPVEILRRVLERASPWLPTDLATEAMELCITLSSPKSVRVGTLERNFALKAIRELPTEAALFSDDGPGKAYKVLRRLKQLDDFTLADAEIASLEQAISSTPGVPAAESLLVLLQQTKGSLVSRLQNLGTSGISPRVRADVENMVVRVIDAIAERARDTAPGVELAISDWLNNLENNPEGMRRTVQQYSMVLAATCQQSVSKPMRDAKFESELVFRTVIVDEAARANPLDLLIPMSLAEDRIILVGDHRQLPHILDPDIEREIEKSAQEETRHALRKSLFERLFLELRKREKSDGVIRTVTLNQQYRMHPILGRFVSKQFYEPYGEKLESGQVDKDYAHAVSLKNGESLAGKVAAWIDVPRKHGEESRGQSKQRPGEACRIAEEVHAFLPNFPELTIGVITFYAAQRDQIWSSMCDIGIAQKDENGFHVREKWQHTDEGKERLRVGTVDSFQGKEFDIVFLSLTRSNKVQVKNEVTRRRKYGFLLLENRLCVAMSRQCRLLLVVGDSAMASGPEATESVPGLCAFKNLCEGTNGSFIRT